MEPPVTIFLTLGGLLMLGALSDVLSGRIPVPRVTVLILAGVGIGPAGLDLLPPAAQDWYPMIAQMALLIIGLLLGRRLSRRALRESGRMVFTFSVFEVLGVALLVFAGLWLAGAPIELAMILAGIAPASAPAAVLSVTEEAAAQGPFTDTLLGVVAVDDAWGLIVFSVLLAVATALTAGGGVLAALSLGAQELGGSLAIGVLLGLPAAYLLRYVSTPMETEALALVFMVGGAALYLGASFTLAAIVLGATLANLAPETTEPDNAIKRLEQPVLVIFFILAGAQADVGSLADIGWIGVLYIILRTIGLISGATLGGILGRAPPAHSFWMGPAILPQAGVALGMALIAGQRFPQLQGDILAVVIGATILFEIVGPIFTRLSLLRVGEAGKA